MYSLKHVDDEGKENIEAVVSVNFDHKKNELIGYDLPPGGVKVEKVRHDNGIVYVMNEAGKTVGVYNLRKK